MKKIKILLTIAICLFVPGILQAADVILTWSPVEGAAGYKVYYGLESRTYQDPKDAENNTTFEMKDFPAGKVWFFAVTAYNQYGESEYSDEIKSLILPAPGGFSGKIVYIYENGKVVQVEIQ